MSPHKVRTAKSPLLELNRIWTGMRMIGIIFSQLPLVFGSQGRDGPKNIGSSYYKYLNKDLWIPEAEV